MVAPVPIITQQTTSLMNKKITHKMVSKAISSRIVCNKTARINHSERVLEEEEVERERGLLQLRNLKSCRL